MQVLITGGAGFVGSNLALALLDRGIRVRVLDDFFTGLASNLSGYPVEVWVGDIRNSGVGEEAMNGVDSVVHLAARGSVPRSIADPGETHDVNANATLNILEAASASGVHVI